MESTIAVMVGISLAASCGFRIFVPMLVTSIATYSGYLQVADGFEWIGSQTAIVAFAVATIVEVVAFYVPWLDNLLDTIASPCAVIAGVILFAACFADVNPFLQWSLAVIAGGGSAAVVQTGSVATRLASTTTTGGFANFGFSTIETVSSFVTSVLAVLAPLLAVLLLLVAIACMYYVGRIVLRQLYRKHDESNG